MDAFMKGILSRVLTEELANQKKWQEDERRQGMPDEICNRDYNIARITEFMEQNNIPYFQKC